MLSDMTKVKYKKTPKAGHWKDEFLKRTKIPTKPNAEFDIQTFQNLMKNGN